jgi:hypothetical protein
MGLEGEQILILAADAVFFRDALGGETHGHVGLGTLFHQFGIRGDLVPAHGKHRHAFQASSENHFGVAEIYPVGSESDALQARRTIAVDRHARRRLRQARHEADEAGDVHALLGLRHGAAENHVFDVFGFDAGSAFHHFADGMRRQAVGAHVGERTPAALGYGSADSGYYDCF